MMFSCDTFCILKGYGEDDSFYFAKNSDRSPNEASQVVYCEGQNHDENEELKCTYITIPQAPVTYSTLLCKPYWMWGAEMGVNEFGVCIGNEAIVTKVKPLVQSSLLGMDILRIALERSETAEQAKNIICNLISTYGQGGAGSHGDLVYYDNSFLIVDFKEAWIVETIGSFWITKRKTKKFAVISNTITIMDDWDSYSNELEDYAISNNWKKPGEPLNFRNAYYEHNLFSMFGEGDSRRARICFLISNLKKKKYLLRMLWLFVKIMEIISILD